MTRANSTRLAVAVVAAAVLLSLGAVAWADVAQAREHYRKGQAMFAEGDYQAAVYEFEAAERIAPSPLNDFNIALSYERMGNRVSAVRYYRSYLDRMPGASNKADVQAKIRALEAELRAEAERAEKQRKPEPPPAKVEPPPAKVEAPPAKAPAPAPSEPLGAPPGDAERVTQDPPAPATGDVSGGAPPAAGAVVERDHRRPPASTGDPELDRVARIDVGAVRDERQRGMRGGSSHEEFGRRSPRGEPPAAPPPARDEPPKSKPAYKQWWFWVVVGVSAIILIDIASTDSDRAGAAPAAGATLFTF